MQNQHLHLSLAGVLLTAMILFSSCSPGGLFSGDLMYTPHREVPADVQSLQEALIALSEGDRAGRIVLTEAEFSALLRLFLVSDPTMNAMTTEETSSAIQDVSVRFEPDNVTFKIMLTEGYVPLIPSDVAINVDGELRTVDGQLLFKVNRLGVGVFPIVSPELQSLLEAEITESFGQIINRASPLGVTIESGTITIDVP